jgi:epoxyqueuosine reductase
MKAALRQRARELGFDDCRFTTAAAPASAPHLQDWLTTGQHGEMAYLQRNAPKRVDPQLVLPGARSVIVFASSYEIANPQSAIRNPQSGVVARYARFTDYHAVLGERLKALTAFMNEQGGADTRSLWYVDTGPVLERDFAQRAGIGFIGKHTNVISRRLGNWIFLAEILTTLELQPDEPEKNRCGSCSRCISACPTRAITAPFQLDARRCISYLTIELKGSIPLELRPLIGNRIYGCDDCLAACPWNKFARPTRHIEFHPRADLAAPKLADLATLDEVAFRARFSRTAIKRIGWDRMLRNLRIAMGNASNASSGQQPTSVSL